MVNIPPAKTVAPARTPIENQRGRRRCLVLGAVRDMSAPSSKGYHRFIVEGSSALENPSKWPHMVVGQLCRTAEWPTVESHAVSRWSLATFSMAESWSVGMPMKWTRATRSRAFPPTQPPALFPDGVRMRATADSSDSAATEQIADSERLSDRTGVVTLGAPRPGDQRGLGRPSLHALWAKLRVRLWSPPPGAAR
jgi:hypothetical protein